VPSHAPQQSFGAAFIVDDIVRQFARLLPPRAIAPDLYLFDMEALAIEWVGLSAERE